jgi:hypothetical protein
LGVLKPRSRGKACREVEVIWIFLEGFWRFPEDGMIEPRCGCFSAVFEQQRATEILTSAAAKKHRQQDEFE